MSITEMGTCPSPSHLRRPPRETQAPQPCSLTTGVAVRRASRLTDLTTPTAPFAPTYLQANLLILPSRYGADFRNLCLRNPVPCPLLAESREPGAFSAPLISHLPGLPDEAIVSQDVGEFDVRTDFPRYNVYRDGAIVKTGVTDVLEDFDVDDHVTFLIGCSFSFDLALSAPAQNLAPPHIKYNRNVSMYRTRLPLCAAGVFSGSCMVVSMRPYRRQDVPRVRDVTRKYRVTHGEPLGWGWDFARRIGVRDVGMVDWGDEPVDGKGHPFVHRGEGADGETEDPEEWVPVFWGCGVTPQEAVMRAGLEGTVIGHAPGHMLVLDVRDGDIATPSL